MSSAAAELSWPTILGRLIQGEDLTVDGAQWAMSQVMTGDATDAQIAAFAVALRSKGETAAEMTGLAGAMLAAAHRIEIPGPAVDVVGTGGDRSHSVNISTMAALVVAGTGARSHQRGHRRDVHRVRTVAPCPDDVYSRTGNLDAVGRGEHGAG